MDRSNVITLLSNARSQDATGVWRDGEETQREIFCQVDSVSRAEFFAAGQSGLRPEYKITVFFGDYQGETNVIRTENGSTFFDESADRSAPYFNIIIDGITVK